MLRSRTGRWVIWLALSWVLLTACDFLYPSAVGESFTTAPLEAGASIGFFGCTVAGIVVFARIVTWPQRHQSSRSD
jgi:hypothetical protein